MAGLLRMTAPEEFVILGEAARVFVILSKAKNLKPRRGITYYKPRRGNIFIAQGNALGMDIISIPSPVRASYKMIK